MDEAEFGSLAAKSITLFKSHQETFCRKRCFWMSKAAYSIQDNIISDMRILQLGTINFILFVRDVEWLNIIFVFM